MSIAIDAARMGGAAMAGALDALSAPIYTTDASGRITFFNRACIDFAGRTPDLSQDRWCVTWKLYTSEGSFLPHDQCPMAVALRDKRPVRGAEAIAERPDGTRRHFTPYPTPLLDEAGEVSGAINMLVDITGRKQAEELDAQATRCRRLARSVTDRRTADTLSLMASEYADKAQELRRPN